MQSNILDGNNCIKNENCAGKGAGVDGRKGLQVEKNSLLGLGLDSSRNIPHSFVGVRNKLKVRLVLRRFIIRVFSFFLIYTRENEIPLCEGSVKRTFGTHFNVKYTILSCTFSINLLSTNSWVCFNFTRKMEKLGVFKVYHKQYEDM